MADSKIQEEARLRYPKVIGKIIATGDLNDYRREAFIAGAEWQKEQKLKVIKEVVNPAQLPTWRKASNHYEEPCIGSAFEKTGRRYTALYMGDFYIDLDELYDKLPKAAYKEDEK